MAHTSYMQETPLQVNRCIVAAQQILQCCLILTAVRDHCNALLRENLMLSSDAIIDWLSQGGTASHSKEIPVAHGMTKSAPVIHTSCVKSMVMCL